MTEIFSDTNKSTQNWHKLEHKLLRLRKRNSHEFWVSLVTLHTLSVQTAQHK